MMTLRSLCCALALASAPFLHAQNPPVLPAGEAFFWDREPVVATSSTRGEISLNGLWYFQPLSGETKRPPGDWAAIRVPGAWESQRTWGNAPLPGFVGRPPLWPGMEYRAESEPPRSYVSKLGRGWYEREITIPKEWAGRKIVLEFERISTDAEILLNDQKAGATSWPGGEVDITAVAKPGMKLNLAVAVTATGSEKELLQMMREDYADKGDREIRQRGIVGNVWLRSQPAAASLEGIAIQPSVQKKDLTVIADTHGLRAPGLAKVSAVIREWPAGTEVKRFVSDVPVTPTQPVRVSWPWPDPKLWEIGAPHLYTLSYKIEAAGLVDEVTERFGFREFRVEGRNFLLNGKVFHGRMAHASADSIGGMREAAQAEISRALGNGYNLLEIWPNDTFRRGLADFRADYARIADEEGILLLMPLIRPDDVFAWHKPIAPELHEKWLDANRTHVARVRNSPSVAGYLFFGNEFMTSDDQNPHRIGNRAALAQSQPRDVAPALKLIEDLRKLDPTRFICSHSGAQVGDVHTVNHYLGLTPLQEGEETLSIWSKTGDMPYAAVEFCAPFSTDMHRARESWNAESEPLVTEFLAARLGPASYAAESPEYRKHVANMYNKQNRRFVGGAGGVGGREGYTGYAPYQKVQDKAFRRLWRSWRTFGVSGGMIQWEKPLEATVKGDAAVPPFEPGRRGFYLSKVPAKWLADKPADPATLEPQQLSYHQGIQPLVAYLGGGDGQDGWVGKEHHFTGGQPVKQSAVLLNDSRRDEPYAATWRLQIPGQPAPLTGELKGVLAVGTPAILPITFQTPAVAQKTTVNLELDAVIGTGPQAIKLKDSKSLTLYPVLPAKAGVAVQAFDPEGVTTRELTALGYKVTPWTAGPPAPGAVVVVGRKATSDPKFPSAALRDFVKAGGRAVIFGQDPEFLRGRAGVRVHRWIGREFWPVPTQSTHPILAGISAEDLRNWAGAGSLIHPYSADDMKTSAVRKSYPTYGFRVGARNSVSSAAWEKPHRSGWTPILEGEFDLAYSPLMELTLEKGLVVLCSLDVEGRNEPVARMLTQRVVDYAAAAKPEPRRPVFYLGNPQGETLLQSLSAPFTKAAGAVPAGALLVVGPGATLADPLVRSVAAGGGRVFAFGQEQIPAGPAVEQKPFRCGDTTPCLERTARPHRERSPLAHRKNAAAARG